MTSNTRKADQLGYPARLLLVDRSTDRRYTADAIPAETLPDLDRDIGACCLLGEHARPRYIVDGREEPTIPTTSSLRAGSGVADGSCITTCQPQKAAQDWQSACPAPASRRYGARP